MTKIRVGPVRAPGESGYGYDQLGFGWELPKKVKHPARYSEALYPTFARMLVGVRRILDPMAGVGGVHRLMLLIPGCETYGVEIQERWAKVHPRTQVGNAVCLPWPENSFDAICVSPTYGNRVNDDYEAKDNSQRLNYRWCHGSPLDLENTGKYKFRSAAYKDLHRRAWTDAVRVLCPGGRFVLNVKNFHEGEKVIDIVSWHAEVLGSLGLREVEREAVRTPGNRYGSNGGLRVDHEMVILFRKEGN